MKATIKNFVIFVPSCEMMWAQPPLQRWMARNREKLAELGCRPTDKMIYPKALQWICREFCIDVE